MKKYIVISLIVIVAILVAAYVYFSGKEYVVRIPESQIKENIDKKLPVTKRYFLIFEVTLKNPRILLEEGSNRINGGMVVVLNIYLGNNPKPLGGSVDISGGIKYVSKKGEFYLINPVIEKFNIQGIPDMYTDKANAAISKILKEVYEKYPIYTLSSLNGKELSAKLILKSVVVKNKELVVTLGI